jgi:hypothetical protein
VSRKRSHVRIKSDGTPQNTSIFVDGVELRNVVSFEIRGTIEQLQVFDVRLRMYIDEIDVDGVLEVARDRDLVMMADQEAIERTVTLLGETGASALTQRLMEMLVALGKDRVG